MGFSEHTEIMFLHTFQQTVNREDILSWDEIVGISHKVFVSFCLSSFAGDYWTWPNMNCYHKRDHNVIFPNPLAKLFLSQKKAKL